MDLKVYQRQMWITVKKYLSLLSAKTEEADHDKSVKKELGSLLTQIVSINENQKIVLSALRRNKANSLVSHADPVEDYEVDSEDLRNSPTLAVPALEPVINSGDVESSDIDTTPVLNANKWYADDAPLEVEPMSEDASTDLRDLVTTEEFMHSIGLLTLRECEDVVEKRRERNKRNGHSHIFCLAIWEKQETKRKRRDWLVSGSPPQLRRKTRPNSEPSSRQPSRGASPVEGSSSPSSSLSPPSPASPILSPMYNLSVEEICPTCKQKGANIQCDGCGVFYHMACVNYFEERDALTDWLCLKCERFGLRTTYTDPLFHHLSKGNEKRQMRR